ncbi:MAG: hypothetical protein ABWZ98_02505 [Nakamurella sp.]
MRKSLCWTIVKPGPIDDRPGSTMTAADDSGSRAGDDVHAGGDRGRTGEPGREIELDDSDDAPLVLTGRLWPTFASRTVVLNPGSALPFAEADWSDALVVIESGELEVETVSGLLRQFRAGEILWFAGLGLRVLRCCGTEPTVLKAVSRGRPD